MNTLKTFDISKVNNLDRLLFVGYSGSGKGTLLNKILYDHRDDYGRFLVFSSTDHLNQDITSHIPKIFQWSEYHPNLIQSMIEHQQANVAFNNGEHNFTKEGIHKTSGEKHGFLVIIDDMSQDKRLKNCEQLENVLSTGRHYMATTFIIVHDLTNIKPTSRKNFNYIFIFKDMTGIQKTATFLGMTTKQVREMFEKLGKYECLVFGDGEIKKMKLREDQMPPKNFKMGDDFYHFLNDKIHNPNTIDVNSEIAHNVQESIK